jgi:hypothetical protein
MSEQLKNFLVDLASDPERMKRFSQDPNTELESTGLSADEKDAVLSRDASRLRAALGKPDHASLTQNLAAKKPRKAAKKPAKKTKRPSKRKTRR